MATHTIRIDEMEEGNKIYFKGTLYKLGEFVAYSKKDTLPDLLRDLAHQVEAIDYIKKKLDD